MSGFSEEPDDFAYPTGRRLASSGRGVSLLFVLVSVPMMDRRSLSRRPDYEAVMARLPALLPRVRRG